MRTIDLDHRPGASAVYSVRRIRLLDQGLGLTFGRSLALVALSPSVATLKRVSPIRGHFDNSVK